MQKSEYTTLTEILSGDPFAVRPKLQKFMESVVVEEKEPAKRTQSQHNSLFLWFDWIEKEAENEGVTWDMIIRHTHQLRITKDGLHAMAKELIKKMWGYTSTKQLKKQGDIDIVIDHFTDLLSKEMNEIPAFPNEADKPSTLQNIADASKLDYPTEYKEPTI